MQEFYNSFRTISFLPLICSINGVHALANIIVHLVVLDHNFGFFAMILGQCKALQAWGLCTKDGVSRSSPQRPCGVRRTFATFRRTHLQPASGVFPVQL
jgi:hypothetical protein